MGKESEFEALQEVRLRNDPGRRGFLTGKVREHAGTRKHQVKFVDGTSFHPDYELELIEEDDGDAFGYLQRASFGRVGDLRRNLSHIQLNGRVANLVYSMDTTNTEFLAYQFKPVLSFLESPSNGLLIADEVGLGKTIEAGLIWTELRARYDARRVVVVCPAMLREKWRDELSDRFAVDARIQNAEELLETLQKDKNQVPDGHGVVCSIQGLRPPTHIHDEVEVSSPRQRLAQFLDKQSDEDPVIDLLIIDEAHYLRNPQSQTAKLGHLLRDVSENVVLLSATPVNLKDDDLFHLLNLVDPDSFDAKEVFPQVLQANEPLNRARQLALDTGSDEVQILESLREAQRHPLLAANRQLRTLINQERSLCDLDDKAERIDLANRIERINLLRHALTRTRKVDVTEWRVVREPKALFVPLPANGVERELYDAVTDAVRRYAVDSDISEGFLLATPQRQVSSCMYAAVKAWRQRGGGDDGAEQAYEDLGVDLTDVGSPVSPLIEHLRNTVASQVNLDELYASDSKYEWFIETVSDYLTKYRNEKIIVFSYFRGTLNYLYERLRQDGIESQVLVGGLAESKQEIINRFRSSETFRVLLSSEVASEGVDLQFSRVLINYDLPWNPMKVEQRIGRLDRIGQKAEKISILNFGYENTIDENIYSRLYLRLNIFERAIGGMDAVLGERISELTAELLSERLSPEQERERIDKTALAIERIRKDQEELDEKASQLIAHGGYIMEQVTAAHEFRKRITEDDLISYVQDYLQRHGEGHIFKQSDEEERDFWIKLPPALAGKFEEYVHKRRLFGQTRLGGGQEIRCRFLNKVRDRWSSIETISQFHPLIRFISDDLTSRGEAFHPLVAVRLNQEAAGVPPGIYGFVIQRWCFDGLRVDEELRARVVDVSTQSMLAADPSWDLVNKARIEGEDWLSAPNEVNVESVDELLKECDAVLDRDYQSASRDRKNENRDRVDFQIQSSQKHRDRQLASLRAVLDEHRAKGRKKLIAPTEGRIRKVQERFDVQTERLRQKAELKSHPLEVCMGVINVR